MNPQIIPHDILVKFTSQTKLTGFSIISRDNPDYWSGFQNALEDVHTTCKDWGKMWNDNYEDEEFRSELEFRMKNLGASWNLG